MDEQTYRKSHHSTELHPLGGLGLKIILTFPIFLFNLYNLRSEMEFGMERDACIRMKLDDLIVKCRLLGIGGNSQLLQSAWRWLLVESVHSLFEGKHSLHLPPHARSVGDPIRYSVGYLSNNL